MVRSTTAVAFRSSGRFVRCTACPGSAASSVLNSLPSSGFVRGYHIIAFLLHQLWDRLRGRPGVCKRLQARVEALEARPKAKAKPRKDG